MQLGDAAEIVLSLACAGAAAGLWYRHKKSQQKTKPAPQSAEAAALKVGSSRPGNQLQILSASELEVKIGITSLREHIRSSMGFTPENWNTDVVPLIDAFLEYVQLLPASESHHHAQPGGLAQHTLEVASFALKIRAGRKLPPGGSPEEQIEQAPVWSYAVLIAALLHDIGKPVADVTVRLFGQDPAQDMGRWAGLAGPMKNTPSASYYSVSFESAKDYQQHSRLPVILLHAMVPHTGLQWLARYPEVLATVIDYLEGSSKDTALHDMIREADSLSVSENLRSGSRIRFNSARSPALVERLHTGMCSLIASGHLAFNRPGAACFISPDGQDLWCVAGTLAEQVRKHLDAMETRLTGAAKLPTDNTRFFDTWAEYGVLSLAPKEFGKGAVWWVRVDIEGWSQVLTMLRFPVKHFSELRLPEPMAGSLTPVSPTSTKPAAAAAATETELDPATATLPDTLATVQEQAEPCESGVEIPAQPSEPPPVTAPAAGGAVQMPSFLEEFLDASETAQSAAMAPPVAPKKHNQAVQAMPKASGLFALAVGRTPRALLKHPQSSPQPNAEKFMQWLQNGLGTGELNYNESDAAIHFVSQGMLILTPKIFKLYLENHPYEGEIGAAKDALRALQGEIQRSGYIQRNGKTNFHYYQVVNSDEAASGRVINTYLIPNPQAYIRPVPAPNPLLQQCQADGSALPALSRTAT